MTVILAALVYFSVIPGTCETYRITGYSRESFPGITADGTPTRTREPIAAGSYNLPLGSYVRVGQIGTFRIADRGYLDHRHIDILVDTDAEAYRLTSYRRVCRVA